VNTFVILGSAATKATTSGSMPSAGGAITSAALVERRLMEVTALAAAMMLGEGQLRRARRGPVAPGDPSW
jgi:hypothetical protein